MTLDPLISEFDATERALARAVRDDHGRDSCASLLRRSADLLDLIETYQPRNATERRDKAFFFLRRGLSGSGLTASGRDIDIALALSAVPPDGKDAPLVPAAANAPAVMSSQTVIDYVRASRERVSLIDQEYRYVATSEANARRYNTRPVRMTGLHLVEIIGRERFEGRTRARIDACLAGEPQEYYHRDGDDADPRIQRCQMKPITLSGLGPMVVVYMRDVTDVVMGKVALEPLVPASHLGDADSTGETAPG